MDVTCGTRLLLLKRNETVFSLKAIEETDLQTSSSNPRRCYNRGIGKVSSYGGKKFCEDGGIGGEPWRMSRVSFGGGMEKKAWQARGKVQSNVCICGIKGYAVETEAHLFGWLLSWGSYENTYGNVPCRHPSPGSVIDQGSQLTPSEICKPVHLGSHQDHGHP